MRIRRRRHLGFSGLLFIGLTALIGVGAINSQNNLLFFAFGLAIAAILGSGMIGGAIIMGVRVEREPPETGQVGEPLTFRYAVHNNARFLPAFALTITERDAAPAAWAGVLPRPSTFAAHVPARRTVHADAAVVPLRRGVATLGAVRVESAFPFGVFRKSVTFPPSSPPARVLIRPAVLALRPGSLREFVAAGAEGAATTRSVGRADEFFGLREYAAGDSLRQIAWRTSARTGDLVVRENTAPSPARVWVVLDLAGPESGLSAAERDELNERAISLAASLIVLADRESVDAGLDAPQADLRIAPRAGAGHVAQVLDALAQLDAGALRWGAEHTLAPERGAVVIVHAAQDPGRPAPPGVHRLWAGRAASMLAHEPAPAGAAA